MGGVKDNAPLSEAPASLVTVNVLAKRPREHFAPLMALKVYTLAKCSTCRAATKWLREHKIAFDELAIRETPPSAKELRAMIAAQPGLRRVFNSSGLDYRAQGLSERIDGLSQDDAVALLGSNGNLVKRPFVIGDGIALVGFDEAAWRKAFGKG